MAKGFKEAAANIRPVYNTVIGARKDTQEVHEVQEVQDVHNTHDVQHTQEVQEAPQAPVKKAPRTQGRKGERLPRVNMSFEHDNLQYLRVMAGIRGESMTQYVNRLIREDRERRREDYEAARLLAEKGRGDQNG